MKLPFCWGKRPFFRLVVFGFTEVGNETDKVGAWEVGKKKIW